MFCDHPAVVTAHTGLYVSANFPSSGSGDAMTDALWPLGLYFVLAVAILGGMLVVSHFLGERHRDVDTDRPYESGVEGTGSARVRLSAQFHLAAMFFVIFDLEVAFLFTWAVAASEVSWLGFTAATLFIVVFEIVWGYLRAIGGLDWGRKPGGRPRSTRSPGPIGERAYERFIFHLATSTPWIGGSRNRPSRTSPRAEISVSGNCIHRRATSGTSPSTPTAVPAIWTVHSGTVS
jgi:NADH-quinone oxidoreductase subunit A